MVCMYILLERPRSDLFYLHKSISYGIHTYMTKQANSWPGALRGEGRGAFLHDNDIRSIHVDR